MTRELNVLLLGETGSGKSTTLCAIANFQLFNTFEEARNNLPQLKEPVPSNFKLPYGNDGEFIVKSGEDANERSGGGQSATVAPASYLFPFGNCILRIIDTPGMGDTAGKETDINNFNLIMDTLAPYDRLHGVVFVVDGKSKRRTTFFTYCIKNLVEQLHSNIKQNIVFCFTNSETSPGKFGAGSGYEILEGLLKDEVGLHLKKVDDDRNCFFVENQCYRLLVAVKRGYKTNKFEDEISSSSWKYSEQQLHAMFGCILALPPHELKQTLSINSAKRFIRQMYRPIVVLSKSLNENIKQLEVEEQEIEQLANTTESLKDNAEKLMKRYKNMYMYDVEIQARQKPVLVCTARKCADFVKYEGRVKWIYKTKCCEPCRNVFLWTGTVGEWGIFWCNVMDEDATCSNCGCSASVHRRDVYDYHKVKRPMANQAEYDELQGKLSAASSEKEQKKEFLNKLRQTIEELQAEKSTLETASARFDYFINEQSLMKSNSKFIEHLNELSAALFKYPDNAHECTLADLESIKLAHTRRLAELKESIRSGSDGPISVDEIQRLQRKLLTLKYSGASFRNFLNENQKKAEQAKKAEKIILLGNKFTSLLAKLFNPFS